MSETLTGASADIKYISIARVSDATVLLSLPSDKTKKAYAEEVSNHLF